MAVLFIRKPSETPNIQNIDDIRMVRYAYGNQNGYIKGYGAELSHNATGSTFLINSGIFVIQGAEVRIDANGWSESVSGVTNKRYYTVYGEVNLALQTAEIKSTYSHATYPTIEAGDDLTQSTDGTARVLLYRFTATNGIIADVEKVIKEIPYSTDMINQLINGEVKAKIAEYASVDTSKGTIEERLTSLGFRQGSAIPKTGTYFSSLGYYYYSYPSISFDLNYNLEYRVITNTLKRQGNYILFELTIRVDSYTLDTTEITGRLDVLEFEFPAEFKPKESFSKNIGTTPSVINYNSATNRLSFEDYFGEKDSYLYINFGYEAAPIE